MLRKSTIQRTSSSHLQPPPSRGQSNTASLTLPPEAIDQAYDALSEFSKLYRGHLVPSRPTEEQLAVRATPTGTLYMYEGIVLHKGPFDGIWLRAGCVPRTPWHLLWETLKMFVVHFTRSEKEKRRHEPHCKCRAVYVAVSLGSMQAIDFPWLAENGFHFYHYRKAGYDLPMTERATGTGASTGPASLVSTARSPAASARRRWAKEAEAEFVYYWEEPMVAKAKQVPTYATSIEGATGLALSVDGTKVLLVRESKRTGQWGTPGGAVEPGENKLDALSRELREETQLTLDLRSFKPQLLGGYQESRARDNLVNDNFSAFLVKAADDTFTADGVEVVEARWFEWRSLLEMWVNVGRPTTGRVDLPLNHTVKKVKLNVLVWLESWQNGRTIPCDYTQSDQEGHLEGAAKIDYPSIEPSMPSVG